MNHSRAPLQSWDVRRYDSLASTNDEARRLAEAGAAHGTVVVAVEQTRGRGRYGRRWSSPPGNLYASVLLRPECAMAATAQLSLVAGLALAEALQERAPAGLGVALKWPNDVLLHVAKTGGLLLEGAARADGRADWVVIGTGVNIVSCPKKTPYPATCLVEAGFAPVPPETLLDAYLGHLAGWLRRWHAEGFAAIRQRWLGRGFGVGDRIRLRLERREVAGRFLDLTDSGALLLELDGGDRRTITAGEVFRLEP